MRRGIFLLVLPFALLSLKVSVYLDDAPVKNVSLLGLEIKPWQMGVILSSLDGSRLYVPRKEEVYIDGHTVSFPVPRDLPVPFYVYAVLNYPEAEGRVLVNNREGDVKLVLRRVNLSHVYPPAEVNYSDSIYYVSWRGDADHYGVYVSVDGTRYKLYEWTNSKSSRFVSSDKSRNPRRSFLVLPFSSDSTVGVFLPPFSTKAKWTFQKFYYCGRERKDLYYLTDGKLYYVERIGKAKPVLFKEVGKIANFSCDGENLVVEGWSSYLFYKMGSPGTPPVLVESLFKREMPYDIVLWRGKFYAAFSTGVYEVGKKGSKRAFETALSPYVSFYPAEGELAVLDKGEKKVVLVRSRRTVRLDGVPAGLLSRGRTLFVVLTDGRIVRLSDGKKWNFFPLDRLRESPEEFIGVKRDKVYLGRKDFLGLYSGEPFYFEGREFKFKVLRGVETRLTVNGEARGFPVKKDYGYVYWKPLDKFHLEYYLTLRYPEGEKVKVGNFFAVAPVPHGYGRFVERDYKVRLFTALITEAGLQSPPASEEVGKLIDEVSAYFFSRSRFKFLPRFSLTVETMPICEKDLPRLAGDGLVIAVGSDGEALVATSGGVKRFPGLEDALVWGVASDIGCSYSADLSEVDGCLFAANYRGKEEVFKDSDSDGVPDEGELPLTEESLGFSTSSSDSDSDGLDDAEELATFPFLSSFGGYSWVLHYKPGLDKDSDSDSVVDGKDDYPYVPLRRERGKWSLRLDVEGSEVTVEWDSNFVRVAGADAKVLLLQPGGKVEVVDAENGEFDLRWKSPEGFNVILNGKTVVFPPGYFFELKSEGVRILNHRENAKKRRKANTEDLF